MTTHVCIGGAKGWTHVLKKKRGEKPKLSRLFVGLKDGSHYNSFYPLIYFFCLQIFFHAVERVSRWIKALWQNFGRFLFVWLPTVLLLQQNLIGDASSIYILSLYQLVHYATHSQQQRAFIEGWPRRAKMDFKLLRKETSSSISEMLRCKVQLMSQSQMIVMMLLDVNISIRKS